MLRSLAKAADQTQENIKLPRVLLVDDDPVFVSLVSEMLENTYNVSIASDGAHALALLEVIHFDAMIIDLMMPILDGRGLMMELRTRSITTPVMIVSAGWNLRGLARELGAFDYLSKPFEMKTLESMLMKAMVVNPEHFEPQMHHSLAG